MNNLLPAKAILLFLGVIFCFNLVGQDRHFTLYGEARMTDKMMYCDLKAGEDYEIASMQFGFHHDSRSSQFIGTESDIAELEHNHFNEVCPNYIRMTWNHSNGDHIKVKKGETVISLVYQINREEPYFICMMDSGRDFCENFLREVLDADFQKYVVDDICIEYRLEYDKAVVTDVIDELRKSCEVQFRLAEEALYVEVPKMAAERRLWLFINDMRARVVKEQNLVEGINKIELGDLLSGSYTYSVSLEGHLVKNGKVIKP